MRFYLIQRQGIKLPFLIRLVVCFSRQTCIETKPHRNGWKVFEALGETQNKKPPRGESCRESEMVFLFRSLRG
jgi:hypothetical protein